EIELRRDRAAALPDLALPGDPAEIDRDAASPHCGAEEIRKHLEPAEALRSHAPASRDDALGVAEIDGARIGGHHPTETWRRGARGAAARRKSTRATPRRGAGARPPLVRRRECRGGA